MENKEVQNSQETRERARSFNISTISKVYLKEDILFKALT